MTTPKRVVHLTTVHHPSDPRIYHKECLSLHRAGYNVTLISQKDEETQKDWPITHIPLKTYKSRWRRMIFGTIDAYRKAKQLKADVYHFHDPELLPVGWLLKKKTNRVVYDI
ncbi:MAG TPA: glycosyltransferase, partial [Cerasibacillus sp.]|uniref:glycosyltransferase n=1 Tax=Cerasibacillus sp. TaxID=2498711 RepID=UPI002F3F1668